MLFLGEAFAAIRDFFESGGPVLYGIFIATVLMWFFIIERFWFFYRVLPMEIREARGDWESRSNFDSWQAHRIRELLISEISVKAHRFLSVIDTLMQILPLLGLLGTVWGMIQVFEVITVFGTANARLMAGGVSQATIPTMAGLVAALSGLYVATHLKQRAKREIERVGELLARD